MKAPRHPVHLRFFQSRVARRIFLLFVACALVPLGALALYSFIRVRSHLFDLSQRRLQQACKASAMAIMERLTVLEADLHGIASELPEAPQGTASVRDPLGRIRSHFRSLEIRDRESIVSLRLAGGLAAVPGLSPEERVHLESGKSLVKGWRTGGKPAVLMARLVDAAAPARGLLWGEINPDYLWGGETFLTPSAELEVLTEDRNVLFTTHPRHIAGQELTRAMQNSGHSGWFEWSWANVDYLASYWVLFLRPTYYHSLIFVQSEDTGEVLAPLHRFSSAFILIVLLTFLTVTLASLSQIRRSTVPIELLREATRSVRAGDFSHRVSIRSRDEFAELGDSFNEMTESLGHHLEVMGTVNRIGVSLTAEKRETRLLEIILRGAQGVFKADGAALYLTSGEDRLRLSMLHIGSLGLRLPGDEPANLEALDLGALWASSGATARTMHAADIYAPGGAELAPLREFDRRAGYRSRSFLSVPLRNHESEVIGILQLLNAGSGNGKSGAGFSDEDRKLAESLASQAAVALTKNRLVQDLARLVEGLTELISTAIDEKSPHTGGHVRRVVTLTMMIAEAACECRSGPFTDFRLSEDELYELRIAALLHDCGKLTTPVHLTDKATKLETVYDRMALIEARAETVRREHRLAILKDALRESAPEEAGAALSAVDILSADFDGRLQADLEAVRACNHGAEALSTDMQRRLAEIAGRYAWHDGAGRRLPMITEDELHNLRVVSGTLTAEERQVINNHVLSTIRMLEALPYPRKLRHVAAYAGSHHERMDGRGYPRGLTREQIPLQGRIIGIADIFEALTARDRPYKASKSLSEALEIMERMAHEGHIDPDLHELFVREQIHLRYASQYLPKAEPAGSREPQPAE